MPSNSPAAVYCDPATGQHQQITTINLAALLCQVTHKVFNIPAGHKDLFTWFCHFIHIMLQTSCTTPVSEIPKSRTASVGIATPF
jgi:hypothetical protein